MSKLTSMLYERLLKIKNKFSGKLFQKLYISDISSYATDSLLRAIFGTYPISETWFLFQIFYCIIIHTIKCFSDIWT